MPVIATYLRHCAPFIRGLVHYLQPETAKRLKMLALTRGTSIQALGAQALEDVIANTENQEPLAC